jgi:hypothetical protein
MVAPSLGMARGRSFGVAMVKRVVSAGRCAMAVWFMPAARSSRLCR